MKNYLGRSIFATVLKFKVVSLFILGTSPLSCGGENVGPDFITQRGVANGAGPQRDMQLQDFIDDENLQADPTAGLDLAAIETPLAQLGMKLFFTKGLGGNFDSACVTCHHPSLGGGDELPLPVGTSANVDDLLGPGRSHQDGVPLVPRNAPTVFNAALWDRGMFLDSRIESLGGETGANGSESGIRTPDSAFGIADGNAGPNLPAAQARFPVTSDAEMRGFTFEEGSSNEEIRAHLAARIGDYGEGAGELGSNDWLRAFQTAFNSSAEASDLITFDNIAIAIAEYERSMVFVSSPWHEYLAGNDNAITDSQKRGANLFFRGPRQGGAGCSNCHSGDAFSDSRHHVVGFPQIGPGKGDGANGDDDFGRARESGRTRDRYAFRTPSLLNVAVTGPWGHAGAYDSLTEVVRHYSNPQQTVSNYFDDGAWCQLDQFSDIPNCESLYPNAEANTELALSVMNTNGDERVPNINLNPQEVSDIVSFLEALTDPCVLSRSCLSAWIPQASEALDSHQLNAFDENGNLL